MLFCLLVLGAAVLVFWIPWDDWTAPVDASGAPPGRSGQEPAPVAVPGGPPTWDASHPPADTDLQAQLRFLLGDVKTPAGSPLEDAVVKLRFVDDPE